MTAGSVERTLMPSALRPAPGSGLIRAAGPVDADRIRDFVCGLSPRSQYFRFFASVAPPSTGLLRALCGATGSADILLLTDSCGNVIGHAMAADAPAAQAGAAQAPAAQAGAAQARAAQARASDARPTDSRLEANIGLVIADDWQHCGLGTMLLSMLVSRAARRGVEALVLDVLPDNARMRGIIARRWPDAPTERTRDALIFRPPIRQADAMNLAAVPAVIGLCRPQADRHAVTQPGGTGAPDRSAA
jgi:GNAT superfamily N-acetyltransferase